MRLISYKDYISSPNTEAGITFCLDIQIAQKIVISVDQEKKLVLECVTFLKNLCESYKAVPQIVGTAMNILHFYLKRVAFTEMDRFMVSSVSFYIACKIDYHHLKLEEVATFYFQQQSKKTKKYREWGQKEIIEVLMPDFVTMEMKILQMLDFDFEFDLPVHYIKHFSTVFKEGLRSDLVGSRDEGMKQTLQVHYERFIEFALKLVRDSYQLPLCLYFPGAVIAAACLLISDRVINRLCIQQGSLVAKTLVSIQFGDILQRHLNRPSFLKIATTPPALTISDDTSSRSLQEMLWPGAVVNEQTANAIASEWLEQLLRVSRDQAQPNIIIPNVLYKINPNDCIVRQQ